MENIIRKIKQRYPLSDSSLELLVSHLTPCTFPRRHTLVREGGFCRMAYFIEKGVTRSYWLVDGKEVTTWFSTEGDITFSMNESYYGKPSDEFVETLEEVLLYSIPLRTLDELYETHIEIANWGRVIHQEGYKQLHRIHKERLTLPAKERYEIMLKEFPDIFNRVNLGYIASYLGITPPTLSKIRAEY